MIDAETALRLHHDTARERRQAATHYRLTAPLLRARRQERWTRWTAKLNRRLNAHAQRRRLHPA